MLTKSQRLLLYLVELKGGCVSDKTKLAKYQYFTDFIHYAFNNKPVSEETIVYTKQKQGPLARNFSDDLEELERQGFIKEDPKYNFKRLKKKYGKSLLPQEKKTANFVISKYGNLNFQELISICHKQEPYLSADKKAIVEFFTTYHRVHEYPDYEQFKN